MTDQAKHSSETSCTKKAAVDFDKQLLLHIRSSFNYEAEFMITRELAIASDGFGTLLHYAATYGNTMVTQHLIELGCEIDFPGQNKKTPLMLAVLAGRTASMKVLLSADANIDIVDDDGQSALRAALNRNYVNCDIVEPFVRKLRVKTRTIKELAERLVTAGGNMYHASTLGDIDLLEYLLKRRIDINSIGPNGGTGLHASAELKHQHVAKWLIANGADVNALDNCGNSALRVSAHNGSKDTMKILLEHGAELDHANHHDGLTAVEVAWKKEIYGERFVECLKLLREYGAKTTSEKKQERERNLRLSNFKFDEDLLSDIRLGRGLLSYQLNVDVVVARDNEGTLLHHAARHGNSDAAEQLIEYGSKVDVLEAGLTPLMLAVRQESAPIVRALLEANANIDLTDDEGRSALEMALERDFFGSGVAAFIRVLRAKTRMIGELADILIKAGANMYHATNSKDIDLMECMLERGIDVDSRGHRGKTGLHEVASRFYEKSGELLVEHGADVNAVDDDGQSPLLLAASNRNKDTLKILLERGADPNLKNRLDESSPLFVLFEKIQRPFCETEVECVELLLRYGAIPQNSSITSATIFDHALDRSSDEATRMLISQLAMLEIRGLSVTKSVMRCEDPSHQSEVPKFEAFHETCLRVLEIAVFGKFSLFDLLDSTDGRLQLLARNEEFVLEVRKICFERKLKELNCYYFKRLMERIDRASRVVMLKNEAIRVICKLFDGCYEECYIFARIVVDYLNFRDLEKLNEMANTLLF